jgi:hypothetical protein
MGPRDHGPQDYGTKEEDAEKQTADRELPHKEGEKLDLGKRRGEGGPRGKSRNAESRKLKCGGGGGGKS